MTYLRASTHLSGQSRQVSRTSAAIALARLSAASAPTALRNGITLAYSRDCSRSRPIPFSRHQSEPFRSRFSRKAIKSGPSLIIKCSPRATSDSFPLRANPTCAHGRVTILKVVRNCVPIVANHIAGQVLKSGSRQSFAAHHRERGRRYSSPPLVLPAPIHGVAP